MTLIVTAPAPWRCALSTQHVEDLADDRGGGARPAAGDACDAQRPRVGGERPAPAPSSVVEQLGEVGLACGARMSRATASSVSIVACSRSTWASARAQLGRRVAAQLDRLELDPQRGQRRAQLVGGVGAERALARDEVRRAAGRCRRARRAICVGLARRRRAVHGREVALARAGGRRRPVARAARASRRPSTSAASTASATTSAAKPASASHARCVARGAPRRRCAGRARRRSPARRRAAARRPRAGRRGVGRPASRCASPSRTTRVGARRAAPGDAPAGEVVDGEPSRLGGSSTGRGRWGRGRSRAWRRSVSRCRRSSSSSR